MYVQKIFVKPGSDDSASSLFELVQSACASGTVDVTLESDVIYVRLDGSYISLRRNTEDYVANEAEEFANDYGMDCSNSTTCFDMSGHDPELYLCADPAQIDFALLASGHYEIWDQDDNSRVALASVLGRKAHFILGILGDTTVDKLVATLKKKPNTDGITTDAVIDFVNSSPEYTLDGDTIRKS